MIRPLLKFAAFSVIAISTASGVVWSQTTQQVQVPQSGDAQSATPPAVAAAAGLPGTGQLWQITRQTTVEGQAPTTRTLSLCTGPDDLKTPPADLTGPQCPGQTFSPEGGTISWTSECETARAKGSITVSSDSQSLAGDIIDTLGNATVHITGVVTGTCNRA